MVIQQLLAESQRMRDFLSMRADRFDQGLTLMGQLVGTKTEVIELDAEVGSVPERGGGQDLAAQSPAASSQVTAVASKRVGERD